MTGLQEAIASSIAARKPSSTDDALLDFDEFWPIVECIEQLAIHIDLSKRDHAEISVNEQEFGRGVARLAAAGDQTAQVQLAWVVNELLERSDDEQALGRAVATGLAREAGVQHARGALQILAAYKKAKVSKDAVLLDASIAKTEAFTLDREEVFREKTQEIVDRVIVGQQIVVERKVKGTTTELFEADDFSESSVERAAIAIGKACNLLLVKATPRSALEGIAALAAVRLTLSALCDDLKGHTELVKKEGPPVLVASLLAQGVCRWLMEEFGHGRVSGFIVVESMESIRDARPGDAAEAMFEFLQRGRSSLDPGIAVCVAEGIEDELYKAEEADAKYSEAERLRRAIERRRVLLAHARFEPQGGGWSSPVGEDINDIRRFWRISLPMFAGRQRQEIPKWMNLRLGLRRAKPRRYPTGVVVE
jgi:hypothetical protein